MSTRQRKRAKSRAKKRAPVKKQRKGQLAFVAVLLVVMLAGGAAAALLRTQPRQITRGAIQGEHWHAGYTIEICGKRLQSYPFVEGDVHTHGDGLIHIHPTSQSTTLDNANLGRFFLTVESGIGESRDGKRFVRFPDGTKYEDGGTCQGSSETYDLEVKLNGSDVKGDPADLILHDDDEVLIRFGPAADDDDQEELLNPLVRPPAGQQVPPPAGE